MNPEQLYFSTIDDFANTAGINQADASALNFGVSKQIVNAGSIIEPKQFLGAAESKSLDICLKPEAGLLGIYYQKLEDLWDAPSDAQLLGQKLQNAKAFISFSHENPVESLLSFDYWKFYDSSLGTFTQLTEDEASFPFAAHKCEGVAWGIYDKSEFDYNKTTDDYGRPIWQFAMDSAEEYHQKAANIYIGYGGHPWGIKNSTHRKDFTNIITEDSGDQKEDENEDAGKWKDDVSFNANLFDPEWSYYDHAQWARVYAKVIGSKYKDTQPKDNFFEQTKLLTINDLLLLNVRKSQTQFSIDDVFGQDDKDAIISITDTEIIINDTEAKDPSRPHEIDFYTPCTCFSRSPDSKFLNYANAIGRECRPCWEFMRDEQERINDGYDIYTIKVHDVSKAGSWDEANSQYYSKNKCGSPQACLHNWLRYNTKTERMEDDPAYLPNQNCWNQTAKHLDCGSNYAISESEKIWIIPDVIGTYGEVNPYTYDSRTAKNPVIQNATDIDGDHKVSVVWVAHESQVETVYNKYKNEPHNLDGWDLYDRDTSDGYSILKGCGFCYVGWAVTWNNSSRPKKERLKGWFAEHNPFVTPEEHIDLNVGDMCCGYSEIFNYAKWEDGSPPSATYTKTEYIDGEVIERTKNYTGRQLKVGPNVCYEITAKETINPSYDKYKAARLLQYTG